MPSTSTTLFAALAALVSLSGSAHAACPASRPLAFCCMNVAPFSTNSGVWGNICGAQAAPSTLIGARCTSLTTCPSGTQATCCATFVPGPSGQCSLGVDCGSPVTPSSSSSPSSTSSASTPSGTPSLPAGWDTAYACAGDIPDRVLASGYSVQDTENNTPGSCVARCAARGYKLAGVEYGSECYCANAYRVTPDARPTSECSTPCSGNPALTCGGGWRLQIYASSAGPPAPPPLPAGWETAHACAVDVPDRVLAAPVITQDFAANTPASCAARCDAGGYTYAGVEYGNECQCSTGYRTAVTDAPASECNTDCTGAPGVSCGGGWRIQIYRKV